MVLDTQVDSPTINLDEGGESSPLTGLDADSPCNLVDTGIIQRYLIVTGGSGRGSEKVGDEGFPSVLTKGPPQHNGEIPDRENQGNLEIWPQHRVFCIPIK